MSKVFYDCEFIDDGTTIELISIGMVAEDGEELYLVNRDVSLERIYSHPWLRENVWPSLPGRWWPGNGDVDSFLAWDRDAVEVVPRANIREAVSSFIKAKSYATDVELWAWYGAYDHVCLAQLWGPMSELPSHVPMWTNDLRQIVQRLEKLNGKRLMFELPKQQNGLHNALADARHLNRRYQWLEAHYGPNI